LDVELVPFPICEGMIPIPYGYRDYTVGNYCHLFRLLIYNMTGHNLGDLAQLALRSLR